MISSLYMLYICHICLDTNTKKWFNMLEVGSSVQREGKELERFGVGTFQFPVFTRFVHPTGDKYFKANLLLNWQTLSTLDYASSLQLAWRVEISRFPKRYLPQYINFSTSLKLHCDIRVSLPNRLDENSIIKFTFFRRWFVAENEERRLLNPRAPERLVWTAHRVRKHPRLVLPFLPLRRLRRHRGDNFEFGVISNSPLKNTKFPLRGHRWNPGKSPGKVGESRERLWRHQPAEAKVAQPKEGAYTYICLHLQD